jgi:hypothetical protein
MKPLLISMLSLAIFVFPAESFSQQRVKGSGETLALKKFQTKYGFDVN